MRAYHLMAPLSIAVAFGCSQSPIETIRYDESAIAAFANSGGESAPIDACWLSAKEFSVFVGTLVSTPQQNGPLSHCPEPMYYNDWIVVDVDVIDTAIGNAPKSADTFHLIHPNALPFQPVAQGDTLLMAGRFWAPTNAWIVTDIIGVELNSGTTSVTQSDRAVDLPSRWSDLVSELKQARNSDCSPKAWHGEYDDTEFEASTLRAGKQDYSDNCSPQPMPAPDDGDPNSTDPSGR